MPDAPHFKDFKTDGPISLRGRPPRTLARVEVAEMLDRVMRYSEHLLLLPEAETVDEMHQAAVGFVEAAGREAIAVSAPGTPYEAVKAIGEALAKANGRDWQAPAGQYYLDLYRPFLGLLNELELPRRGLGPVLVLKDLSPDTATVVFARGRDEAWAWDLQVIVVAPRDDFEHYLLGVSDSFFMQRVYFVGS